MHCWREKFIQLKVQKKLFLLSKRTKNLQLPAWSTTNLWASLLRVKLPRSELTIRFAKKIKTSLALLDLTHPDESIRLDAVKSTYKSISKEVVNTMQLLLKQRKVKL